MLIRLSAGKSFIIHSSSIKISCLKFNLLNILQVGSLKSNFYFCNQSLPLDNDPTFLAKIFQIKEICLTDMKTESITSNIFSAAAFIYISFFRWFAPSGTKINPHSFRTP